MDEVSSGMSKSTGKFSCGQFAIAVVLIVVFGLLFAFMNGGEASMNGDEASMDGDELCDKIRKFALGATIVSVGIGILNVLIEINSSGVMKVESVRTSFLKQSGLVFILILSIVLSSVLYIEKEMWHFFLYFLIFLFLVGYENRWIKNLDQASIHGPAYESLCGLYKYCDWPAMLAFFAVFIAFVVDEYIGVNLIRMNLHDDINEDINIASVMVAGAVGFHMLLTSVIAVHSFSRAP